MKKKVALALGMILAASSMVNAQQVVKKSLAPENPDINEKVIVNGDTVNIVIPERNFGRYDRGLFNYLFIPKGKWGFGLTASYGELSTDDTQILSLVENVDFKGKMYSIKPFITYFVRNNQSIGIRFNYSRGVGDLDNMSMNFDDDLNFNIHDVSYYSETFSTSLFYRNYIGLSKNGRFGVFNEVDVTVGSGSNRFKRIYDSQPKDTRTTITQGSINFSPGVAIFIQEYMAFNVSFGVFGLNFRREHQVTDGIDEGSRFTSGANFRFNIFNINFGLMVVI
ncbi:MAG: hypothetical protein NC405_07735 [Odoribacter sp.]|nr:hypothetical protein [Odoribacter sp.]